IIRYIVSRILIHPRSSLFPYTTLFRSPPRRPTPWVEPRASAMSESARDREVCWTGRENHWAASRAARQTSRSLADSDIADARGRSEEHTSELQSRFDIVCRLLLEKKRT